MEEIWVLLSATLAGAVLRVIFGIRKAYLEGPVDIDWMRVFIELISSILFGGFAMYSLVSMGLAKFSFSPIVAVVGGFLGPDLLTVLAKKVGVTSINPDVKRKKPKAQKGIPKAPKFKKK